MANKNITQISTIQSTFNPTSIFYAVTGGTTDTQVTGQVIAPWMLQTFPGFLATGSGAVARTIQSKNQDIVSVKDFGAVGNGVTDDTAAINTAIIAVGNGNLYFPQGTYLISSALTVPLGNVPFISGAGESAVTILQSNLTANGIVFNPNGNTGGGISNLTIGGKVTVFTNQGSTGIGLSISNANEGFTVENLVIRNFDTGIQEALSFSCFFKNIVVKYFSTYGIQIPTSASVIQNDSRYYSVKIQNISFANPNAAIGLFIGESGGHFFSDFDILNCNKGVVLQPVASQTLAFCEFKNVLSDSSISDNWTIDGTNGSLDAIRLTDCWGAFSTNGSGLVIKGANTTGVQVLGGAYRENGLNGIQLQGGINVSFTGVHVAQNSKLTTNTSDGVLISAGVSSFQINSCRIGNFASGLSTTQANGITMSGASTNFIIANNDLTGFGAGKTGLNNTTTSGINQIIFGNTPATTVSSLTGPVSILDPSTSSTSSLLLSATGDTNGVNLQMTGNGGTTPTKWIRVASGNMQILSNAYNPIVQIDDFGDLIITGGLTPSTTSGIVGTTVANNANAGSVGEYITATSSNTSLTNNTILNLTSISLTAGDWDVWGAFNYTAAGTTTTTQLQCGISTTSVTFPANPLSYFSNGNFPTAAIHQVTVPQQRINVSTTTTVYLPMSASFATSTATGQGFIAARRVR